MSATDGPGTAGQQLSDADRHKIADAYMEIAIEKDRPDWSGRLKIELEADRFRNCGHQYRVYECDQKCGRRFKMPVSCNSRICPKCGRRMYFRVRDRLYQAIEGFWSYRAKTYGPKFVTLTFQVDRFDGFPSRSDLKRCQAEVREFVIRFFNKWKGRRSRNGNWYASKTWRGAGAIVVWELGKFNNLHAHLLAYGPYLDQDYLSRVWKEITGDSLIVDVRAAKNPKAAVAYILKYVTKPPDKKALNAIAAWAWLLKGSRRLATYGVCYGIVSTAPARSKKRLVCLFCGRDIRYLGVEKDPDNLLFDWVSLSKYIEDFGAPRDGPGWLHTYLDISPDGAPDKRYHLT